MPETPRTRDHDDTGLAVRVTGLTLTACGLAAAAQQLTAIAVQVAEGLSGLVDDVRHQPPRLTGDNREPGFFRIAVGTGAVMEPAERGERHVAMAAVAAGFPEPVGEDRAAEAAAQIPRIMADLWALAARYDLTIGTLIEAAMATARVRVTTD